MQFKGAAEITQIISSAHKEDYNHLKLQHARVSVTLFQPSWTLHAYMVHEHVFRQILINTKYK